MGLVSLENQIKIQAYWDAFRTGGLQFSFLPDRRDTDAIHAELQTAISEGDIATTAGDTIHLLRRHRISLHKAAESMTQVHTNAVMQYLLAHDHEERRDIHGPIDFFKREDREARLEMAKEQVARRRIHWSKLEAESLKTAPLRIRTAK